MPTEHDILKVGKRYTVVRTADNTPIGPTFPTRREAVDYMYEMEAEEYRDGTMIAATATPEQAARTTVELAAARAIGKFRNPPADITEPTPHEH